MPGKTARALCPVCQEPMPPDETECGNCGAFVIDEAVVRLCRAFGIDREKALALFEKGFRHPTQLQNRDPDDVLTNGENGLLFLCTNCGGFVATGDLKCARCGAEFEEEPPTRSVEPDILDLVLCPVCGADNDPTLPECEICGEALKDRPVPAVAAPSPPAPKAPAAAAPQEPKLKTVDEFLEGLEELEDLDMAEPKPAPVQTDAKFAPAPKVQKIPKLPKARAPPKPELELPPTPKPTGKTAATPSRPLPKPQPKPLAVNMSVPGPSPPASAPAVRPTPPKAPRPVQLRPAPVPATTTNPHRDVRPKRRSWIAPPPEFTGAIVTASAASLYLASALSPSRALPGIAWGATFVLGAVAVYAVAALPTVRGLRANRIDFGLLAAGVIVGLAGQGAPESVAPFLIAAAAVPLALATRRLRKNPARAFLVGAAAIGLLGFAVAAGLGLPFASTTAWDLGLVAYAPWPALLVASELTRRRLTLALRKELSRAERDISRKDYAQSLEDYDRAIELSRAGVPGEDLPWYGKGATLILLGRYEEALRAIDVALDINPRNEVAWLNKGNALMKLGRHLDALRCFNAGLRVNPRYEVAWNNKGNALARMGHYEEALRCYERALSIDPDYRGSWVNKGYVLTKLGRYDEAASCADRALRLDRRPPEPA